MIERAGLKFGSESQDLEFVCDDRVGGPGLNTSDKL